MTSGASKKAQHAKNRRDPAAFHIDARGVWAYYAGSAATPRGSMDMAAMMIWKGLSRWNSKSANGSRRI